VTWEQLREEVPVRIKRIVSKLAGVEIGKLTEWLSGSE